jgi:hypothetical protein
MVTEATRNRVLAQWTYSELLTRQEYERLVFIQALSIKQAQGLAFGELHQNERDNLVRAWNIVRGQGDQSDFAIALRNVKSFRLVEWTKDQLGNVYVIPYFVEDIGQPRHALVTFKGWITTDPIRELEKTNARHAHHGASPPGASDPAIVGQLGGVERLLDGYHRAVRFWYRAERGARFPVWQPVA